MSPAEDMAFNLSRIAHWLVADRGFTKQMAAAELGRLARKLDARTAEAALGAALHLTPEIR